MPHSAPTYKLRQSILRQAIDIVNGKPSPRTIPLSDPQKLRVRDYYSAIYRPVCAIGEFLLQGEADSGGMSGYWRSEDRTECKEWQLTLDELTVMAPEYIQYIGELEIRYCSSLEFVVHHWLRIPTAKLICFRARRWMWRRKALVRNDWMNVLRHMVNRVRGDRRDYVSVEMLMHEFHGSTWSYAKGAEGDHAYYRLLLKSMVATGDVEYREGYKATAQALKTLADFELEDRRHRQTIGQQRAIVTLTVVLAIIGFLQVAVAGLAYFKPPQSSATAPAGRANS
jgi:hypothetical protein